MADENNATSLCAPLHSTDDLGNCLSSLKNSVPRSIPAGSSPTWATSDCWQRSWPRMSSKKSFTDLCSISRHGTSILHSDVEGAKVCPFDGVKYRKVAFSQNLFTTSDGRDNKNHRQDFLQDFDKTSPVLEGSGLSESLSVEDDTMAISAFADTTLNGDLLHLKSATMPSDGSFSRLVSDQRFNNQRSLIKHNAKFSGKDKLRTRAMLARRGKKSPRSSSRGDGTPLREIDIINSGYDFHKDRASGSRRGHEETYEHIKDTCEYMYA